MMPSKLNEDEEGVGTATEWLGVNNCTTSTWRNVALLGLLKVTGACPITVGMRKKSVAATMPVRHQMRNENMRGLVIFLV